MSHAILYYINQSLLTNWLKIIQVQDNIRLCLDIISAFFRGQLDEFLTVFEQNCAFCDNWYLVLLVKLFVFGFIVQDETIVVSYVKICFLWWRSYFLCLAICQSIIEGVNVVITVCFICDAIIVSCFIMFCFDNGWTKPTDT